MKNCTTCEYYHGGCYAPLPLPLQDDGFSNDLLNLRVKENPEIWEDCECWEPIDHKGN